MTPTTIWLLVRWGVGLILGAVLVRRFRTSIRAAVGFCFPMKQRMNPNFFSRIQKYTTITAIALALLFAVVTNLAYLRWVQAQEKTENQMTILSPLPVPEEQPIPFSIPESGESEASSNKVFPELPEESVTPPVKVVRPAELPSSYEVASSNPAYLQLGAFRESANAQRLKNAWSSRSSYTSYIAILPDDSPYKVLLGPFPNLDAARQFRRQYQLSAFPRLASHYPSIQL
ncbi:MAG: SPOR domain-containing protein [Bacteroidota bacterium]